MHALLIPFYLFMVIYLAVVAVFQVKNGDSDDLKDLDRSSKFDGDDDLVEDAWMDEVSQSPLNVIDKSKLSRNDRQILDILQAAQKSGRLQVSSVTSRFPARGSS